MKIWKENNDTKNWMNCIQSIQFSHELSWNLNFNFSVSVICELYICICIMCIVVSLKLLEISSISRSCGLTATTSGVSRQMSSSSTA